MKEPKCELDLEAIRKRCEAASPGPWLSPANQQPWLDSASDINAVKCGTGYNQSLLHRNWKETCANIDFLTQARQDIPALLAEVKSLKAERETLLKDLAEARRDAEKAGSF